MAEVMEIDCKDFIETVTRLSEILKHETFLMKEMKIAQLHDLLEEKTRLTSILEEYKKILASNPELKKDIPSDILNTMREETKKFEKILTEQEIPLLKARKVHNIIMEALKSVIGKKLSGSANYTKKGMFDLDKKKMKNIPAVSIFKTV